MPTLEPITDEALVQAVVRFLERHGARDGLAWLTCHLPGTAQIFVAGGALRNIVMAAVYGRSPPTRDIDCFIGGLPETFSLPDILVHQPAEPTDLKGMRWHPAGSDLVFDLCRLSDFVVIDTAGWAPTLDNLLAGIDFTMNAIAYDVHRHRLVERGCRAAIRERTIAFNSGMIPDKGLIAYRILLMAHKTGFALAPPVFAFLRQQVALETLVQVKGLLRAKQGKAAAQAIMADYNRLCRFPSHSAYLAEWSNPSTSKTLHPAKHS